MEEGLTPFAKSLRCRQTETERLLWKHLRAKQFEGLKFRRQQPIGKYIADFVCFEKRVIIELDGGQHALPRERLKDQERDRWLEAQGFRVLRFWDNDVFTNTEGVLEVIRETLLPSPSPQSPPIKGGEVKMESRQGRGVRMESRQGRGVRMESRQGKGSKNGVPSREGE